MDISKHKILKDLYDAMGVVESLGCSEEITELSIKLGQIAEETEQYIDTVRKCYPY